MIVSVSIGVERLRGPGTEGGSLEGQVGAGHAVVWSSLQPSP